MTALGIISFVALVATVSGASNCGCPSVDGTKVIYNNNNNIIIIIIYFLLFVHFITC